MALTLSRTAQQIEDWRERGLIDAATARTLTDDLGANETTRSFASVAVWLGIICLAFGAMTFVAANWDALSRFMRMAVLMGGVLASYIAAAVLYRRNYSGLAESFVVLGCGVFGAAVMLTGQMYHLSGPPAGGIFLWALGTFIAAVATGSAGALGLSIILTTLWTTMTMTTGGGEPFHLLFLPVWAVLAVYVWWIRARWVAHLCAMGLLVWLGVSLITVIVENMDFTAMYLALMAGFAGISLAIASARSVRVLRGFEGAAVLYLLVLVYGAIAFLYGFREIDGFTIPALPVMASALPFAALAVWPAFVLRERFDHILATIWVGMTIIVALLLLEEFPYIVEAFALAVSVWTIRMGGRQGWAMVTTLGYFAFAVTMFIIYTVAAHGLLGTSFFYIGAGVLLLVGALVVPRFVPDREGRT